MGNQSQVAAALAMKPKAMRRMPHGIPGGFPGPTQGGRPAPGMPGDTPGPTQFMPKPFRSPPTIK